MISYVRLLNENRIFPFLELKFRRGQHPPYFFYIQRVLKVPGISCVAEFSGVPVYTGITHFLAVNPDTRAGL